MDPLAIVVRLYIYRHLVATTLTASGNHCLYTSVKNIMMPVCLLKMMAIKMFWKCTEL